ncbi:MAG: DUF4132 domain-containing protein [Stackebrandtia sp.]
MSSAPLWHRATGNHELALDGSTLVCRNAKNEILKSVPTAARNSGVGERLVRLRERLRHHESECRTTVDSWLVATAPVPVSMLAAVWPDPAWRGCLSNLVVRVDGEAKPGFLTEISAEGRVATASLGGDTREHHPAHLTIGHPAILPDVDNWRARAEDTGVAQRVQQLKRRVHRKPADIDESATSVDTYSGTRFEELRTATGRAAAFGFAMRGGYAGCDITEAGTTLRAGFWLGAGDPDRFTETGDLVWTNDADRPVAIKEVGPIAWSEGLRMAELIHSGGNTDAES